MSCDECGFDCDEEDADDIHRRSVKGSEVMSDEVKTVKAEFDGSKKKFLTAEDILSAKDISVIELDVPEWGGTIRLQSMDALKAAKYLEVAQKSPKDAQVQVLIGSAVDLSGAPLFKDESVIIALRRKSLKALMRVQNAAMDLNGLRNLESTVEDAKND